MKFLSFFLLAGFTGSLLMAQLVLPDYFEEEDAESRVERSGSIGDAAHSRENGERDSLSPEALEQQMRQMMQSMTARRPQRGRPAERHGEELALRSYHDLTGGGETVLARLAHADGRRGRLRLPNQTFLVETRAGMLPVRLHEVKEIRAAGEGGAFIFTFWDEDQVRGTLSRLFIRVGDEEVSYRAMPMTGLELISLELPE